MEDVRELVVARDLFHLGAGVRDGDEAAAIAACAFEEMLFENIGFERGARLTGDDEQSSREVHAFLNGSHLRRVRGIEDV